MIEKIRREYVKNKLINSIKIKKFYKNKILSSIIQNNSNVSNLRLCWLVKKKINESTLTKINDICLNSSVYKKSNRSFNLTRHELHKLCRAGNTPGWIKYSW